MDILTQRLRAMAAAIDARLDRVEAVVAQKQPAITVGPVPPPNPQLNQLWVDTN